MIWTQTKNGNAFDLINPHARLVDFQNDVGPALARAARFCGATRGPVAYSVAQHSVLGAEAIFAETNSARLALLFVLHDAHEAYIGDITTPAVEALDYYAGLRGEPGSVRQAASKLKSSLDAVIFEAAGVAMPTASESQRIRAYDLRMLMAERNALMTKPPVAWGIDLERVIPAIIEPVDLEPWDSDCATNEWLDALERLQLASRELPGGANDREWSGHGWEVYP